jgi:glycosyltransferase involved in cell wall biosynthesis
MQVSIIIPVYNAASFITTAVESALEQPETAEVLLIEDGSPDNSLEVCQELAAKYDKIQILRHPNGANRGAGASRNLGMINSTCEYIGFVDADNFYLPGRFSAANEILKSNPDCEGVYEAIGIYVWNDAGLQRWKNSGRASVDRLVTLTKPIQPEQLGAVLIDGQYGSLTLDGLVLKKSVLQKSGYMVEELRLHQDTDFIIRCALVARLYPGRMDEAVAMEGVHDHNRFSAPRSQAREYKNRMALWMSLYRWSKGNSTHDIQKKILNLIVRYTRNHKYIKHFPSKHFPVRLAWIFRLVRLIRYPEVIFGLLKIQKA